MHGYICSFIAMFFSFFATLVSLPQCLLFGLEAIWEQAFLSALEYYVHWYFYINTELQIDFKGVDLLILIFEHK